MSWPWQPLLPAAAQLSVPAVVGPVFVQQAGADDGYNGTTGGPVSSLACNLGATTTTGNFIYVWVWVGENPTDNTPLWTVTDEQGNVYTRITSAVESSFTGAGGATGSKQALYYCNSIIGGASPTITVTLPSAHDYIRMNVGEYENADGMTYIADYAMDSGSTTHGSGTDVVVLGTVDCAVDDIVVGCVQSINGNDNFDVGTGYENYAEMGTGGGAWAREDKKITSGSTAAPTFDTSASDRKFGVAFTLGTYVFDPFPNRTIPVGAGAHR